MGKENNGWLESEKGEAQEEILESRQDPVVLRSTGKQAPNGCVSGFRGSQKNNGHPPNGGPGAPRALPPSSRRPRTQPGARGEMRDAARVARLCPFGPPHSPRGHRSPEDRRQEQTPPDAKKEAQAFLVKADFIGATGPPCTRRPLPARPPGRPPASTRRPVGPSLPSPQAPAPLVPGAARTAHRLPRRRLQRRRPAPECGPGPRRRVLWL